MHGHAWTYSTLAASTAAVAIQSHGTTVVECRFVNLVPKFEGILQTRCETRNNSICTNNTAGVLCRQLQMLA